MCWSAGRHDVTSSACFLSSSFLSLFIFLQTSSLIICDPVTPSWPATWSPHRPAHLLTRPLFPNYPTHFCTVLHISTCSLSDHITSFFLSGAGTSSADCDHQREPGRLPVRRRPPPPPLPPHVTFTPPGLLLHSPAFSLSGFCFFWGLFQSLFLIPDSNKQSHFPLCREMCLNAFKIKMKIRWELQKREMCVHEFMFFCMFLWFPWAWRTGGQRRGVAAMPNDGHYSPLSDAGARSMKLRHFSPERGGGWRGGDEGGWRGERDVKRKKRWRKQGEMSWEWSREGEWVRRKEVERGGGD